MPEKVSVPRPGGVSPEICPQITAVFLLRLRSAFDELTEMLKNEKDLEEKDEYIKAKAALKDAKEQLAA